MANKILTKNDILKLFNTYVQKKNKLPNRVDLQKLGVSRDRVRYHFGDMSSLHSAARKADPSAFDSIVDEHIFTPKALKSLKQDVNNNSKYFITTAVEGCEPHQGFLNAITQTFAGETGGLPLFLTARDPAAATTFQLDSAFADKHIVFDDVKLNNNIFLSSIKLSAKHIDPITGLSRLGQRNGSFIYASPKQRLKVTPTAVLKLPHVIMTTGAVTLPKYKTNRYMSDRTAHIADNDHVIGGLIVETVGKSLFHYRQVQADRDGSFIDLGIKYKPNGTVEEVRPEALILGDWHSGETDPKARLAFIDGKGSVLKTTRPKRLVIHDGFNGRSISHHEMKNTTLRAQRAQRNELSLDAELNEYARDLESLASHDFIEEIIIVKSNHDEFLDRYLSSGRYVDDAGNHSLALELASAAVSGQNPIQFFVERLGIKNIDKLVWLDRDEDFKISGVELGAHGDQGANGARGSLRAMEAAFANSISGHSHTPEILRGAWQVGTLSLLKLVYNKGPSSWLHTSCLLYSNGSRQLINVIDGEWHG